MQIFELHFNPKLKNDYTFNTFLTEPENTFEKRLGSLYLAGEITSALPKSKDFLTTIAKNIKKRFYSLSSKGQEKALTQTLKDINDFFTEEVKKENINWLGNLNFVILSIKDNNLVFSKTGNTKILLIRGGHITDIGKNLNLEGIEPYPVKIFLNIASGILSEEDILLTVSNDVFDFMKERGVLDSLTRIKNPDEKKIKQALPHSLFTKGDGAKISGFSLMFLLKKEKDSFPLTFKAKERVERTFFSPVVKPIKSSLERLKKIKLITKKRHSLPKVKKPFVSLKVPALRTPTVEKFQKISNFKKKAVLIGALLLIIAIGFVIFRGAESKEEKEVKATFIEIEKKVSQAESFLLLKEKNEANKLFKEAYIEISPLAEKDCSIAPSISSLQETIERNLEKLNNLEKINPEVFIVLSEEEMGFEPQKIAYSLKNIYLYSKEKIYKISTTNENKEKTTLTGEVKFIDTNSGTCLGHSPGTILFSQKEIWDKKELNSLSFDFEHDLFSSYLFNLYFIEKESCQIVKYSYLNNFKWGSPIKWNDELERRCENPKSMAIDGSIWILNENDSITRYYTGSFQENIVLDIFPFIKNFEEIKTRPSVDLLYFLEPQNNRVVIATKSGEIFKQFQSESFDNLKSFAISEDGKTLYLLNGLTVYKIEI